MKETLPRISVIIRTYNSGSFVRRALESVLKQTIDPEFYEAVVVDDGSTDDTLAILEQYRKQIRIIKLSHCGAVKALNAAIGRSEGEYVILLDSDDFFAPAILKKMYDFFRKEKTAVFVYSDYCEKPLTGSFRKIVSLKNNIFNSTACGIMFRKKIIEEAGGYDEKLIFPEYDLLIKILKKYEGAYIEEPLFTYCRRRESITGEKEKVKKGREQLFLKYGPIKGLREY